MNLHDEVWLKMHFTFTFRFISLIITFFFLLFILSVHNYINLAFSISSLLFTIQLEHLQHIFQLAERQNSYLKYSLQKQARLKLNLQLVYQSALPSRVCTPTWTNRIWKPESLQRKTTWESQGTGSKESPYALYLFCFCLFLSSPPPRKCAHQIKGFQYSRWNIGSVYCMCVCWRTCLIQY